MRTQCRPAPTHTTAVPRATTPSAAASATRPSQLALGRCRRTPGPAAGRPAATAPDQRSDQPGSTPVRRSAHARSLAHIRQANRADPVLHGVVDLERRLERGGDLPAVLSAERSALRPWLMANPADRYAAQVLAGQASSHVGRAPGREPLRGFLKSMTRGQVGRRHGRLLVPELGTPWQDTISGERTGWRQRTAWLAGEEVFGVDYQVCRRCNLGWVEQPYTNPEYQRCGLASAALRALRVEYPGLSWHTLGGHFRESAPFWSAVGTGVPGGYERREVCPHRSAG